MNFISAYKTPTNIITPWNNNIGLFTFGISTEFGCISHILNYILDYKME
jgi:hypothetical protein